MKNSLVVKAKGKDESAFLELFSHFQSSFLMVKSKYFIYDFDDQDWQQEALIVLANCLQHYEASDEQDLENIFKRALENRSISLLRKEKADKRRAVHYCVSYEQVEHSRQKRISSLKSYTDDPLQQLIVAETLEENSYILSKLERKAFCKYYFDDEFFHSLPLRRGYDRSKRKIIECVKSSNPSYKTTYPPLVKRLT